MLILAACLILILEHRVAGRYRTFLRDSPITFSSLSAVSVTDIPGSLTTDILALLLLALVSLMLSSVFYLSTSGIMG